MKVTAPPPQTTRSLQEICQAARQANCGECWQKQGKPCTQDPEGDHVARFGRAARRGLITGPELAAMAVCFILAVAAGMWLERLADRRGARFAATHGILSRADVILPYPVRVTAVSATAPRPAIGAPQITVNIFSVPSPEQAAVIGQALPGYAITSDARNDGVRHHQDQRGPAS